MEMIVCQSCGMPLKEPEDFGTNAGGGRNEEYCSHCFREGAFTREMTVDQMIELNLTYIDHYRDENGKSYTVEEARPILQEYLPSLKRWKKQ